MKTLRFEKSHEGKDVYVDEESTKNNSVLRITDFDDIKNVEKTQPNIELIAEIIKEGSILICNNIFEEMWFIENAPSRFYFLFCSFEKSFQKHFIVFLEIGQKGEIAREGSTIFLIHSDEKNHSNSPHFHVCYPDGEFSFDFNGKQLAPDTKTPPKRISKKIKRFLSLPDTKKRLTEEWGRISQSF